MILAPGHQGSHLKCMLFSGGYFFCEFPVCVLLRLSARCLSRALVSEQDGRAFCVRSVSNLIIALFLLITRIFGYICQYIRLLTYLATYFVIFFRGF